MAAACSLKTLTQGSLKIVRVRLTTPLKALSVLFNLFFPGYNRPGLDLDKHVWQVYSHASE